MQSRWPLLVQSGALEWFSTLAQRSASTRKESRPRPDPTAPRHGIRSGVGGTCRWSHRRFRLFAGIRERRNEASSGIRSSRIAPRSCLVRISSSSSPTSSVRRCTGQASRGGSTRSHLPMPSCDVRRVVHQRLHGDRNVFPEPCELPDGHLPLVSRRDAHPDRGRPVSRPAESCADGARGCSAGGERRGAARALARSFVRGALRLGPKGGAEPELPPAFRRSARVCARRATRSPTRASGI